MWLVMSELRQDERDTERKQTCELSPPLSSPLHSIPLHSIPSPHAPSHTYSPHNTAQHVSDPATTHYIPTTTIYPQHALSTSPQASHLKLRPKTQYPNPPPPPPLTNSAPQPQPQHEPQFPFLPSPLSPGFANLHQRHERAGGLK